MLTEELRNQLCDEICQRFGVNDAYQQVNSWLDDDIRNRMTHADNRRSYVLNAIEACIRFTGDRHPAALVRFCEQIEANGHLLQFDYRGVAPAPPPVDPFGYHELSGGRPFVGQRMLRSILHSMSSDNASQTVLTLSGGWRSGKTYSSNLIEQHCEELGYELSVPVDATGFGTGYSPADLAASLVVRLGGNADNIEAPHNTTLDTNMMAWYNTLANKVVSAANQAIRDFGYQRIWLFIDGLGEVEYAFDPNDPRPPAKTEPRSDLVEFIKVLTHAVTNGLSRTRFRMIVSGMEAGLREHYPLRVQEHEMEQADDNDIRSFIRYRVRSGGANPEEQEKLAEQMMQMLQQTKVGSRYDLPALHKTLQVI